MHSDTTSTGMIELTDVVRVFGRGDGAVSALDGVSLSLGRGTFTAIMGPSGSGKSTLLQSAAGLDRPTSGRVRLGDHELTELGERALAGLRRERIGFVFQSFNLLGALTAEQNVALPVAAGGPAAAARRRPRRCSSASASASALRHRPAAALRRPAAARGHRPRAGRRARRDLRRRAHRRPRQPLQPLDPRAAAAHRRRGRPHAGDGHPRPVGRRLGRPRRVHGRRPAGRRAARADG